MKYFLPLLFALCLAPALRAQSSVRVQADPDVERVISVFTAQNEAETSVDGWRVQILATTDRNRLETVERQFKVNYPSVPVDWENTNPYYKLRAGAFRTKQEAERLKYTLSQQFEGVYLVKDKVSERELLAMY